MIGKAPVQHANKSVLHQFAHSGCADYLAGTGTRKIGSAIAVIQYLLNGAFLLQQSEFLAQRVKLDSEGVSSQVKQTYRR